MLEQTGIFLRPIHPDDGPGLAALAADTPDTGQINFTAHFQIDVYQALRALHGDVLGIVAEASEGDGILGTGLIRVGHCRYEAQILPYALLYMLMVHPDHRRRGIAAELAKRRVELARQRFGTDVVILANIQKGNTGSQKTAKKWCRQLIGRLLIVPIKPRTRSPDPLKGLDVREAEENEFDEVADKLNAFYRNHNLYEPQTGEELARWCRETPFESPFRHYIVVTDHAGNLLAGLAISEDCRLRTAQVNHMPAALRLMNAAVRFAPPDGVLQGLTVDRIWYTPHQLRLAKYLWETVRWEWRNRGNALTVVLDSRSPLKNVLNLKAWTPKTELHVAVHGPVPMSSEKLICPVV